MKRTNGALVALLVALTAAAGVYAVAGDKGAGSDLTADQIAAIAKPAAGWTDKASPATVELTPEMVQDSKGDGPDGKGNTEDDTWGFWFQTAHDRVSFLRLDLCTARMSADQRANGVRDPKAKKGHQGKVRGPIAGSLPNKDDTEGWIFHSDWDGRYEGVWGDKKAKCVMLHPYVEKVSHGCVALTYRVPGTGVYTISGKVTDLQPVPPAGPKADGITFHIEVLGNGAPVAIKKFAVGDADPKIGRANSVDFKIEKVKLGGGRLLRFSVDPNSWWGADLTRLDLKIERAK